MKKKKTEDDGKITKWFKNPAVLKTTLEPKINGSSKRKRSYQLTLTDGHPYECVSLAVVGSRLFTDQKLGNSAISAFIAWLKHDKRVIIDRLISGGAKGADTVAEVYASEHDIATRVFEPSKSTPSPQRFFDRNQQIANASDYMLALWDGESTGTKDVMRRAKRAGTNVYVYKYMVGSVPVDWHDRMIQESELK